MVKGEGLKIKRRYRLSKKELKKLRALVSAQYAGFPAEKLAGPVERAEAEDIVLYVLDGIPAFYSVKPSEDRLIPVLHYLLRNGYEWLPEVVVDRGATRAVSRGATLMVPGIRRTGSFGKGDIVVIVDEEAGVPVAVGEALLSSEELEERLQGERRGRAVKILHRPGDRVWRLAETL